MSGKRHGAILGSLGFAVGTLVATSFAFFGFVFVGLILGGAAAGAILAWKRGDFRLILVAAISVDLGVLLGGFVVLMSFVLLADDVWDQPPWFALLGFYIMFIAGFAVAGASISAATATRLVSLQGSVKAFSAGGVIGGAIIIAAEVITPLVAFAAVITSAIVAGALCGASLNSSEEVALSILER